MSEELREAVIDLGAIKSNTQVLRDRSGSAGVMAVVKANAYGHGLVLSARAAKTGGAEWLGVALVEEALELRRAGVDGPLLAWLIGHGESMAEAIEARRRPHLMRCGGSSRLPLQPVQWDEPPGYT